MVGRGTSQTAGATLVHGTSHGAETGAILITQVDFIHICGRLTKMCHTHCRTDVEALGKLINKKLSEFQQHETDVKTFLCLTMCAEAKRPKFVK